jgi:Hint domain
LCPARGALNLSFLRGIDGESKFRGRVGRLSFHTVCLSFATLASVAARSPCTAAAVTLFSEMLSCARQLVNGTTIRQEKGRASIEYFHVELDAHVILLAEGLAAESYLNTGNRGFFANSGEPLVLHPDLTDETDYPAREVGSCAPANAA